MDKSFTSGLNKTILLSFRAIPKPKRELITKSNLKQVEFVSASEPRNNRLWEAKLLRSEVTVRLEYQQFVNENDLGL